MKFFSYNVNVLFNFLRKKTIRGILIYGNDKGLVNYRYNEIVRLLNCDVRTYDYKEFSDIGFDLVLNTSNLFTEYEVIKIYNVPVNISELLKKALAIETRNLLVIIGDELPVNSVTRKWFEDKEYLASLACYSNDSQDIFNLLLEVVDKSGKKISDEAAICFSKLMYGNKYLYLNEIEKLLLYCHDCNIIGVEEVRKCCGKELVGSVDLMCIYFCQGLLSDYLEEIKKLKGDNIPDIWILRALTRYYINLYIVLTKKNNGLTTEQAIKTISPPIFFKYVKDFKLIAESKDLSEVIKVLYSLQQAEIAFKTSNYYTKNIVETIFFKVNSKFGDLMNLI